MKRNNVIRVAFGAIALVVMSLMTSCSSYNGMVEAEEAVNSAWGQVENVYRRRADLVPNLVNTVKGAANFEKSTLESVVEARAKATSITIDPSDMTEEDLAKFQKAQDNLSSSLGRLMAVAEAYPELKSNENFLTLQSQLEGTENRIAVERKKFNETVQNYNTTIRKFPRNILASIFGFKQKAYFKAAEGAEQAPNVSFEF